MTDNPADEATLASFGYKQELSRKLRFGSLWAVAFSTISITTGIVLNYGFGLNNFGPAAIWTWPIAVVGQLFVAFVIAELGTRIRWPSYQGGRRLVGAGYGWLLGVDGPALYVGGRRGDRAAGDRTYVGIGLRLE
jgi:hypothetical protein